MFCKLMSNKKPVTYFMSKLVAVRITISENYLKPHDAKIVSGSLKWTPSKATDS